MFWLHTSPSTRLMNYGFYLFGLSLNTISFRLLFYQAIYVSFLFDIFVLKTLNSEFLSRDQDQLVNTVSASLPPEPGDVYCILFAFFEIIFLIMEKIERKDLENRKRDELITKILYEMVYFLLLIYLLKMHQIDSKIRHKTETFRNDNLSKTVDEDDSCKQEEKIILQTIFTDYDKTIMPNKSGLEVQVEMHIQDISSLSELTSDFELDVLFSSIWRDPSLSFEQFKTCETNLTLDLGYLNRIWLPKVCVINSKQAEIHSSPSKNIMLTLYKNGTIWLNYRMKLRAPCAINLRTFPFDKQTCYLVIESYSYNNQRVKLEWLHSAPLTFIRPIELPDFSLTSWSTVKTTLEYPNGFWDQLNATFVFKRRYGFFVLQAYTPTYMTIFVSWISFFMDPRQISARATLGISAFLAMTFQFGTILKNQPPVSYIKSVDFWMLFSIFIMFATLAELAIISYMLKKSGASVGTTSSPSLDSPTANYVSKISALKYAISEAQLANNANCKRNGNIGRLINRSCPTFLQNDDCLFEESKRCWSPDMVDKVALICLPAIFLSFNIFYWAYHLFILN